MPVELVATGMGVCASIGQGKGEFLQGLLNGRHSFDVMRRPGRQRDSQYLGAELPAISLPAQLAPQTLRTASLSTQVAQTVLQEAWEEAGLSAVDPQRIGLIVGGSNVQQRELVLVQEKYRDRPEYLRPTYALSFMDSDICGFCTEAFGIQGPAYTVGGASASGQLAVIQAAHAVLAGQVDACIALGPLMDLSHWECRGFRALGAMGSDRYAEAPERACRPFDRDHDGFIFGEACAAVVIESAQSSRLRDVRPYGALAGWSVAMDAKRSPEPSLSGEIRAIQQALQMADWAPSTVDYLNPHGSGSVVGDRVEIEALRSCGLQAAFINATKSLTGHALSAAGVVEVVATLLQMRAGQLHPTANLENPIDASLAWVRGEKLQHKISSALTLSIGFCGINTALCWQQRG